MLNHFIPFCTSIFTIKRKKCIQPYNKNYILYYIYINAKFFKELKKKKNYEYKYIHYSYEYNILLSLL